LQKLPGQALGGKGKALAAAKAYRNELISQHPPISRREFCTSLRRNNRSGVTGVYRYSKKFTLKNGKVVDRCGRPLGLMARESNPTCPFR
jgi:hypothetical protein